jgi:hypothetical protein
MSILEKILTRKNKGLIPVATPEWDELDGTLAIRRLSPADRTAFYDLVHTDKPQAGIQFLSLIVTYCTVHRETLGEGALPRRAFCDGEWKALSLDLGSGSAIERLAEIADEANVLSDGMRAILKKKYETTPDSGSTCASPEASESQ